jgi:hypothetical protein
MRERRLRTGFVALVVTGVAIGVALAGPAAAQPSNDDFDAATAISTLPYSETIDMSTATAAADDPHPNCMNGVAASVWYTYSTASDALVELDTIGSSSVFNTVAVYTGTRGSLNLVGCSFFGQNFVGFTAKAGTAYHVMVARDVFGGFGSVEFHVKAGPIIGGFAVNSQAAVSHASGIATVSGTVSCTPAGNAAVSGTLSQRLSRLVVASGAFNVQVACTPGQTAWSAQVVAGAGLPFASGHADVNTTAMYCDPTAYTVCANKSANLTVSLKNSH